MVMMTKDKLYQAAAIAYDEEIKQLRATFERNIIMADAVFYELCQTIREMKHE